MRDSREGKDEINSLIMERFATLPINTQTSV